MIVLDTDVLSAIVALRPIQHVVDWLDSQPAAELCVTAVTVYEVRGGIEALPAGRKRSVLEQAFESSLVEIFESRVLPFDWSAAEEAGKLAARRQRTGQPKEHRDTQIAGIVLSRGAALATRNVRHFSDLNIPIIDPWTA
jgi:predicted nucleic acid-binding protein